MEHDNEHAASEHSPLLRPDIRREHSFQLQQSNLAFYLVAFVAFAISCGSFLWEVPIVRIQEDILCHHYYENVQGEGHFALAEKIDESLCKGDDVQRELAILIGGVQMGFSLPGVFLAFPYGLLADRIGRKPVFGLAITGVLLGFVWTMIVCWFWQALPIRLIWIAPVFQVIGGGATVLRSVLFATVSDLSTDERRATNFLFCMTGSFVAELVATPVAALLMQRTPWLPATMGLASLILGGFLVIFVPETLHRTVDGVVGPVIPDSDSESFDPPGKIDRSSIPSVIRSFFAIQFHHMRSATSVLHSLPVLLLLVPFLVDPFIRLAIDLSTRYISKRFSWPLSRTGFLLSLRAAVNIALYLAILPGISHLLTRPRDADRPNFLSKFSLSTRSKDLLLTRGSLLFLIAGSVVMGLSSTIGLTITGLVILTFGTGLQAVCRTVITSVVDKEHVGRLYAILAMVETFGSIGGGPMLALLYTVALKWKGAWFGLPFYFVALCCSFASVAVFCLRLPPEGDGSTRQGLEEAAAVEYRSVAVGGPGDVSI